MMQTNTAGAAPAQNRKYKNPASATPWSLLVALAEGPRTSRELALLLKRDAAMVRYAAVLQIEAGNVASSGIPPGGSNRTTPPVYSITPAGAEFLQTRANSVMRKTPAQRKAAFTKQVLLDTVTRCVRAARAELSEVSGLSLSTVHRYITKLVAEGVVVRKVNHLNEVVYHRARS